LSLLTVLYNRTVLFNVRTSRQKGRLRPRDQFIADPGVSGILVVDEVRHPDLNRVTRRARLIDDRGQELPVSPIIDAALVSARPGWWVMTGFERVDDGLACRDFAQSWVLVPVTGSNGLG
jgi:hypothetical protein